MPNPTSAPQGGLHFSDLAHYLDEQREAILLAWRAAVENDTRMGVVSKLGRVAFEDNIPTSLALFSQQLHREQAVFSKSCAENPSQEDFFNGQAEELEEQQSAQAHGFHRWQEGYDLRQLVMETGHLNQTLVQVFNQYEIDHPAVLQEVMRRSRFMLTQLLDACYLHSVSEYYRLQQSEANEIVHSLSEALETMGQWEQARGEVLRHSVHDLRGNLSAIQGATHLLDNVGGSNTDLEMQQAVFGILQRGTHALYLMLTDLLDLARLEAGQEQRKVRPLDAAHVLRELCIYSQPLAQERELSLASEGLSTLMVEGDVLQIQRIAQNLLLNALKYTLRGGVTMRWSEVNANAWCLSVQDTGPGFPTNIEDDFSSPEVTEQPSGHVHSSGGEGVGIIIVKRLCTLLDAELKVESTLGVGTTMTVIFPTKYEAAK